MDPAQDRLVEIYHTIRCQEKDALVILEFSEKNGHKTIMGIMVRFALLHERICLVQEKHGVEVLGSLEYAFKPLLQHSGIGGSDNKVSSRYLGMLAYPRPRQRVMLTE
jgi:hypothetical protein